MANNTIDYSELAHDARRTFEKEREELMERAEQLTVFMHVLDDFSAMQKENSQLKDEVEMLGQQLDDEKRQRAELEMKLLEMSKLSAGVAKKASQDELLQALRTFINKSKHKRIEKRTAIKEMVLEMAVANGIAFPEDLAATLDSLDDEQTEAKVVTVQGNYNDIHENGNVRLE